MICFQYSARADLLVGYILSVYTIDKVQWFVIGKRYEEWFTIKIIALLNFIVITSIE